MKKTILALLLVFLLVVGCSNKKADISLTSNQTMQKMDNGDSFLLFFSSESCQACEVFKPVYLDVSDEYADALYILDIGQENTNNQEELQKLLIDYTGNVQVTPTVLVIVDGQVEQEFIGILKYSELENALENYQIVK